jgi:hypothetical protein
MPVASRGKACVRSFTLLFSIVLLIGTLAQGQAAYRAQIRGAVSDQTGAVVVNAAITITNDATNIVQTTHTDDHGQYFVVGLLPAVYTIKAESKGFRVSEKKNVVLQVDQQTTVDFVLHPQAAGETVEVTQTASLLDTENATLGTEITSQYVKELPLAGRDFFGLTFLAAGVTEVAGSGASDNYPSGTNFTSNGQRNATAEVRIDGALISAPEQGEGGNSNVYYEPLIESVQEFKVQNNSFSAEFGNNGGTVVNMALKSGTNAFHGSGWYFLQRPQMDARDFFNPEPNPKPNSRRDQGGFSLGGPIRKNKTFFFVDYEKVRSDYAISGMASVPTMAQRTGNFAATATDPTPNPIYDPTQTCTSGPYQRPEVGLDCNGNPVPGETADVIPSTETSAIGLAVLNLYPQPNVPGAGEFGNYQFAGAGHGPDYQFDVKLDHQISEHHSINGRYSRGWSNFYQPTFLGDGFINDGYRSDVVVAQNGGLEYSWTVNPRIVWTNRVAVDRVHELAIPGLPTISSFNASLPSGAQGLSPIFQQANGLDRMPTFMMQGASPWTNLYDQCCLNTTFAHTLYSYSSQLVISKGRHLMKIGGEQRLFYNNFWQPPNPTGILTFTDDVTSPTPNSNLDGLGKATGNPFASLAFGYADNINASTDLIVYPSVANKSKETGFYFQDDWKVNSKLTVNMGIRYEWSTPYNERYNRIEFSDFTGDTGVNLSLNTVPTGAPPGTMSTQATLQSIGVNSPSSEELYGTTLFPTSSMRSVPTYRKDIGPRLGFAYQLDGKTVMRGGAGIYFGMSPATNFQYPGTAFRKQATIFFTNDDFATQSATLSNPFPSGFTGPQGTQYGQLANWGYGNNNDLGTTTARDADIYQWNLGIQRSLPSNLVLSIDYVANRSTHLPWSGTANRDFVSSSLLAQISSTVRSNYESIPANGPGSCDVASCVSNFLQNTNVGNPFSAMFTPPCSPGPCFNEPDSNYGGSTLPLPYLIFPFPQFAQDFEGLMIEEAGSWYNAMQIRFEKRTTHNVSFEGSYTVSKSTDDSSAGRNNWVGSLGNGLPQQLDRLYAEHSISASDTPQRLAAAVILDLPVGRKQWIGGNMNRAFDAVVGGWHIATMITEQSGQPMAIGLATARLMSGSQRPNIVCSQLKSGTSMHKVALDWQANSNGADVSSFFNPNCFADPGDQNPGNGPRYFSGLRVDGIHNMDLNLYKSFVVKEGMSLDLRAEIFNFLNHPRFGQPNSGVGSASSPNPFFGTIEGSATGQAPRYFQFGARFEF